MSNFEMPGAGKKKEGTKKEEKETGGISRRELIKSFGVLALGSAIGYKGLKNIIGTWLGERRGEFDAEMEEKIEEDLEARKEQELIREDNREAISGSTIVEQIRKNEKVTLNESTKKAIYDHWLKSYSPGGRNYAGLEHALERMRPWITSMKASFSRQGVPEEYVYISIVESHFTFDTYSRKLAKGPFQFIKTTGESYDLKMDGAIDERCDPLRSAEACARHLKDSYLRLDKDWKLAMADYNGSYTNRYAGHMIAKREKEGSGKKMNYKNYLAYREAGLNEFLSRPNFEHTVKKGDNLKNIAEMYGLTVEAIKTANGMKSDRITVDQEIKLPPTTEVKLRKLQDALENLNYPEKLMAVIDCINKFGLEKKFAPMPAEFKEEAVRKAKTLSLTHEIKKGEGLFVIAREFKRQAEKNAGQKNAGRNFSLSELENIIMRQNRIADARRIQPGQVIKIDLPIENFMSLTKLAAERSIPKEKLLSLNPSVINPNSPLPEGFKIRFPRASV